MNHYNVGDVVAVFDHRPWDARRLRTGRADFGNNEDCWKPARLTKIYRRGLQLLHLYTRPYPMGPELEAMTAHLHSLGADRDDHLRFYYLLGETRHDLPSL